MRGDHFHSTSAASFKEIHHDLFREVYCVKCQSKLDTTVSEGSLFHEVIQLRHHPVWEQRVFECQLRQPRLHSASRCVAEDGANAGRDGCGDGIGTCISYRLDMTDKSEITHCAPVSSSYGRGRQPWLFQRQVPRGSHPARPRRYLAACSYSIACSLCVLVEGKGNNRVDVSRQHT
ncbi:hypothetical protein VTN96DRAFT_8929 [Rasamsonia emersonii]